MFTTKLSPLMKNVLIRQLTPKNAILRAQSASNLSSGDQPDQSNKPPGDNEPETKPVKKLVKLKKSPGEKSRTYLRVYTRSGDSGKSSLFTGERRSKDDPIFEALGTVDELSSNIGLAMEYGSEHPFRDQLQRVQCLLQDIGSALATPEASARDIHVSKSSIKFNPRHTKELEEWIDEYAEQLPPLQNFILPGGGLPSASLHVSRSVCRRAERQIATLVQQNALDTEILKYMNRLSDFLFTIARFAARLDRKEETIYRRVEDPSPYISGPDGIWKKVKQEERNEEI